MENSYEQTENTLKSKINAGGLISLRLHDLWNKAHKFASTGRLNEWNAILDRVWCELSGDVTKEDIKRYNQINLKLPEKRNSIKRGGFSDSLTDEETLNLMKQYRVLLQKEEFIRKLENKQGKGTAYDEDSDDWE